MRDESRLALLMRFGRENHIPLGVEALGDNWPQSNARSATGKTAGAIINEILGESAPYRISCVSGTVVIRYENGNGQEWLNRRLPRFRIQKTTRSTAAVSLWMQVEIFFDPSQTGFAGSYPPSDPKDEVGPYDIRNATIRGLLCLLAGSSKGAAWVTATGRGGQFLGTADVNRLWTFVLYSPANP
jgi:hypothetical protein